MKDLFILNFRDALVYDETGLLIAAYQWPYGINRSREAVEAMGALIDTNDPSLVSMDVSLYDIHLHHKQLWNNPIVGHA